LGHILPSDINSHEGEYMQEQSTRLIRLKEVIAMTGLSRASVYKFVSENKFPAQISLGYRCVAWVESEVQQWIDQRVQESRREV
jgi:prophage regulatory protein